MYTNKNKRNRPDDENDSDSDNETYMTNSNLSRFLVVTSASEDLPLSKLSPFAIQKAFVGIAGIRLKSNKRLRDGSFLVECVKKHQANNLLKTEKIVDRPVKVTIHKALNSSKGVIRCRERQKRLQAAHARSMRSGSWGQTGLSRHTPPADRPGGGWHQGL